jgi:hypothetical protein
VGHRQRQSRLGGIGIIDERGGPRASSLAPEKPQHEDAVADDFDAIAGERSRRYRPKCM